MSPAKSIPVPATPQLLPTQVLGPYITAMLQEIVDDNHQACMARLRGMSAGELEREDNFALGMLHALDPVLYATSP